MPAKMKIWLELDSKWRESFHLCRRKNECDDLISLRCQIYKVFEQTRLASTLPLEL